MTETTQTTIEQSAGHKTLYERMREYRKKNNIVAEEDLEEPITQQLPKPKKVKKQRKPAEPMSMERYITEFTPDKLKTIDTWTSDKYVLYYSKVLPALKGFMNTVDGYKPVALENNIPYLLETNQITRPCIKCKLSDEPHKKYLLPADKNKLSMFWCELDPLLQGTSVWNRWKVFKQILWSIDDIISKPNMMKTMRSLYYQSAIRYSDRKSLYWTNTWSEISAVNGIVDIDITDKNKADIYEKEDKWGHSRYDVSFEMLSKIADALTKAGIRFKIRSSGNGWYFELEKITIKDHNKPQYENIYCGEDEITITENADGTVDTKTTKKEIVFWNRVMNSIQYVKDCIIRPIIEDNYSKYFELDGGKPNPMKLYKSPESLHQRLDYVAKFTNLDEINDNTAEEFKDLCNPEYIIDGTATVADHFKTWRK